MNSKWTNQRPTSLCQPTIPVCTSAVADTARLASPCRSKCCTAGVEPHHKYAEARGHKRQPLTVGDEAKALAQKILQNSTGMYRHVQTIKWFQMIVWISSATQLLWAWDEPPEPMTTSWESTTRQLHHQKPEVFMAYDDLRENHDICAMTFVPWLPGTPIDRGYVWISRGVASMFQCLTYDVFVPFCPFGPILQLVAKKEPEKCRFLKISPQIENMSRCRVWWSRNLGLTS